MYRCILNYGQAPPTIVLGISGKLESLVNIPLAQSRNVPILRRFTGGGTVVTDENTLFVSFIFNKTDIPTQPLFPREVMRWSEQFYAPIFHQILSSTTVPVEPSTFVPSTSSPPAFDHPRRLSTFSTDQKIIPKFSLQEHDYCFDDRKFGGNAQSISRDRWVHHTSLLWSYTVENMRLLTIPDKRPDYRKDRDHTDFLTCLKDHFPSNNNRHILFDSITDQLHRTIGDVRTIELEDIQHEINQKTIERKTNQWIIPPSLR